MPRLQRTSLMSGLMDRTMPQTAQKREAGFWKLFREAMKKRAKARKLNWTRLETWAMPGVPDIVIQDASGNFHFIELKHTGSNAVDLRPHQVSWLSKHSHGSVWVLGRQQRTNMDEPKLLLFAGSDAVGLKMEGLTKIEPIFECDSPFNWDALLDLICPT